MTDFASQFWGDELPPLLQEVKELCPSVKRERITELRRLMPGMKLEPDCVEMWDRCIAAMEKIPTSDQWWQEVEHLPVLTLLLTVRTALLNDPQWPN